MSNVSHSRCFTKFTSSFVDESLFGARKISTEPEEKPSDFDPPWISEEERKIERNRPLLFYCPSVATSDSNTQKPSTTANEGEMVISSSKSKSRPYSARNRKQQMKFLPSYVDETLFKSTRENNETPFNSEPPWVTDRGKKAKPILWDYSGHRPESSCSQRQDVRQSNGRGKNSRTERMGIGDRKPWR